MGDRLSETKPQPTGNEATLRLSIEGMHCSSCVGHVEKALQSVDGVVDASVSLADSSARVSADGVSPDALVAAVVSAGFEAEPIATRRSLAQERAAAEKRGRSLSRRPDDAMDTSVERSQSLAREPAAKKRRRDASRAASAHRSSSRPPPRNEQGLDGQAAPDRARLLQKKAQKKMNRMARGGEADRKTGPKLIRWMNEGKRRAGTSHHR